MKHMTALKTAAALIALAMSSTACAQSTTEAPMAPEAEQASAKAASPFPPRIIGSVNVDDNTSAPLQYSRSAELNASPGEVWAFITSSKGLAEILDPLESVSETADGRSRTLQFVGGPAVVENVVANDAATRTHAYALAEPNPFGISDHFGVITVTPADAREGSVVAWSLHFNHPDAQAAVPGMISVLDSAMANLTGNFGGFASHGGDEGFGPAIMVQSRLVEAPMNEVWALMAEGYGDAHLWSSGIGSINLTKSEDGNRIGEKRACFIPAFNGEVKETIIQYDEEEGFFAYSIDQGLPPFATYGATTWSMSLVDEETTLLTVKIELDIADGVPPQAVAFARTNFSAGMRIAIDDAKFFLERGEVHPRKAAALKATQPG
ncbi:MAG: SRPBCC family protein [Pseudomonadota bacterium]